MDQDQQFRREGLEGSHDGVVEVSVVETTAAGDGRGRAMELTLTGGVEGRQRPCRRVPRSGRLQVWPSG